MSKIVKIGKVNIGGGNPIAVQSMANVDPHDDYLLVSQVKRLADAGCDIMRLTVPDKEAAEVFGRVKRELMTEGYDIPLVADIHFDHRLAIEAIAQGADKIRINPGNIGSTDKVREVVKAAAERKVPIRVGVNSGSLEKHLIEKYHGVTAEGLAESALDNLRIIEDLGYDELVVSIKSSNVKMNYDAHLILKEKTEHPIHIGITEAGTLKRGQVKSAIGIGALLLNGIGDTLRVSLTADPIEEVYYAREILRTLGLRPSAVDLVSCPTCGRTKVDLERLADEIEKGLEGIEKRLLEEGRLGIKVAVMGCAVNGPGEAREADFGVAGGQGEGLIFSKGEIIKKVSEDRIVSELLEVINNSIFDR
ncbi:MAG: flavodoxin-dependent (E)-4-hydroxy-3-methylbut-2-enyl-diphosphate synthase [Firmicutes bacterium]|nr:flavodoxin-dependent (E)-4-hydroxy-3-methylbut-2-enyl-diphosphate synthase [Bacillota bacterium]